MSQNILKGGITITDDIDFIRNVIYDNNNIMRVISLDENGIIPLDHPNVLGGICLLPPMDALIAEADGDEQSYNIIYFNHFSEPFVEQFVVALIAYLFNGGTLYFYHNDIGSTSIQKLIEMFWKRYGIAIGIQNKSMMIPYSYDESCVPIWLGYLYMANIITPKTFLYLYPEQALITDQIMDKLLIDISPFGESYTDKVNFILDLKSKIKEKPNVKVPIFQIMG